MKVSILFPGQGSQFPGMGKFLYENFRVSQLVFEEASDAIQLDLKKLCFEGSEQDLALTENTQPAILTVSVATWKALNSEVDFKPTFMAGHSVGEYPALVVAGAIQFSDAIKGVQLRGRSMQQAVPVGVGGMCAVLGLDDDSVRVLCELAVQEFQAQTQMKAILSPANFNAPGQVVISGHQKCLEFLKEKIKSEIFPEGLRKAKLIPLNVSAPFHCDLMLPAEEIMGTYLKNIPWTDASTPIVQNVVAEPLLKAESLRLNLVQQVSRSVRWTESVRKMVMSGSTHFIECGAGKVLAGLGKKIQPEIPVLGTGQFEDFRSTLAQLQSFSTVRI